MPGPAASEGNPQNPAAADGDPVAYMLAVMKDNAADPARRDHMAKSAAPFVRTKAGAGRADGRELLEQAVAGSKASLARKLGRLAEVAGVRDGNAG